jgi:hypothetical protein
MIKDIKIDPYKSIFLILLSIFIYCYYLNSKNGRFVQVNDNILDSRNGAIYIHGANSMKETPDSAFVILDPIIK